MENFQLVILKSLATVFLTMAMAAVGISINFSELKSMGYKPFVVGLIAAITVGIVSIVSLETFLKVFCKDKSNYSY